MLASEQKEALTSRISYERREKRRAVILVGANPLARASRVAPRS
jgi:hypothetical protein